MWNEHMIRYIQQRGEGPYPRPVTSEDAARLQKQFMTRDEAQLDEWRKRHDRRHNKKSESK